MSIRKDCEERDEREARERDRHHLPDIDDVIAGIFDLTDTEWERLARVAYENLRASTIGTGKDIATWEDAASEDRTAWHDMIRAVITSIVDEKA